jgi:hypothetical protein
MRTFGQHQISALVAVAIGLFLGGTTYAFAQDDFERCKAIAADRERLDCLKGILATPAPSEDAAAKGFWPLVKTTRSSGAADAIAIMRTAETAQSDPDLAGMMIRCQEQTKLEVLLALVRPLRPGSKRDVSIKLASSEVVLHADTIPAGTALILPIDATVFTTGPWRDLKQLSVKVNDAEGDIRGVVSLKGIATAIAKLTAACAPG